MTKQLYTEHEYKENYNVIKQTMLRQKNKENYPLATLIGGQPGSGKSELTKYIKSQNDNTIAIDGDYIREFHPHLEEIVKEYGMEYPKVTQPFVDRAVEQLIDELSRDKYNLVIEGTLRDVNVPLKTASMLDSRDYLVELYIIATNKDLSWQSTIDRGDEMDCEGKVPRYVDREHHDKVVASLPTTAEELSKSNLFYNVIIMRRDQTIIYDREETKELSPKEILEKELEGEHVKSVDAITKERETDLGDKISLDEQIEETILEVEKDAAELILDFNHNMER